MFALIITWCCKEKFDDVYLIRSSWITAMKLVLFDTLTLVLVLLILVLFDHTSWRYT